jgi:hypothetical protein
MTAEPGCFTTWLAAQKSRNNPVGDLARDAADDSRFPRRVASLNRLTAYLASRGACPGALEAARRAWKEFQTAGGQP